MQLAEGTRLGPYQVLAPIGAGGMGEVYRARDTRLGREVAIKILPSAFAQDPERLAPLNHPHIAAIYGLEEANGARFLVLEVVDGESLASRLARPEGRALHPSVEGTAFRPSRDTRSRSTKRCRSPARSSTRSKPRTTRA